MRRCLSALLTDRWVDLDCYPAGLHFSGSNLRTCWSWLLSRLQVLSFCFTSRLLLLEPWFREDCLRLHDLRYQDFFCCPKLFIASSCVYANGTGTSLHLVCSYSHSADDLKFIMSSYSSPVHGCPVRKLSLSRVHWVFEPSGLATTFYELFVTRLVLYRIFHFYDDTDHISS